MGRYLHTSDWHIRSTVPDCIDATQPEWMETQKQALYKIQEIALENDIKVILMGGDLFHTEKTASFECIHLVQDFVIDCHNRGIEIRFTKGNHDEIGHNDANSYRSAMGVFMNSQYVIDMNSLYNNEVKGCNFDNDDYKGYRIIVKHVLCIPKDKIPFEGMVCETPESLLEKYPDAQYILLGDYHKNFHFEKDGRHVINPGCLTKQASDFEDYTTGVYIVDTDKEEVIWCPVDIEQHFNHNGYEKKALDQSIEQFVEGIKAEDVTLDYVSSLRKEALHHDKPIQDKINNWIEKVGQ